MKKKVISILAIILCSITNVVAQFPIPSYNIDVTRTASFQEQSGLNAMNLVPMAKREVNVLGTCPNMPSGTPCAEVWVYSLDQTRIIGPYTLNSDETLQLSIDTGLWGVYVAVSYETYISVWIGGTL